jgi:precorrin-6B methylase 2
LPDFRYVFEKPQWEVIVDDSTVTENALIERMFQLSTAYIDARAVWIATKLGIADLLAAGPRPVAELAQGAGADPVALHRVLRLVASNGILSETQPGLFALTPLGELLRSDSPVSMRDWVLWTGGPLSDSFRDALHSVQTGKPAFEKVHGVPLYEYLKGHPEDAKNLSGAMVAYSREVIGALMTSFDFRGTERLVDVGAGPGALDIAVLRAHPRMKATLFDLPHVAEQARRTVREAGLTDRCDVLAGNFFESVPEGGDAYLLSAILHNWSDADCRVILNNCKKALGKRGKLLLLEMIVPTADTPHFAKKSDVVMLVGLGGFERTLEAYSALLADSGFRLVKAHPGPYVIQLLEAQPM